MGAVVHTGKLEVIGHPYDGREVVYYAHGSESLRTALGKSKLHISEHCSALLAKNPGKTVIMDWWEDVPDFGRCRRCRPAVK